tara:strand:+ start:715 stop:1059 length:345 start_codon:yes stop_codon:yes gene_type:complete
LEKDNLFNELDEEDRMIMLEDFISVDGNLIENLNCNIEYICNRRPSKCPTCFSEDIVGVQIMGSYSGNLLWECSDCEMDILRFDAELTEKYLKLAVGLWTNPKDWGYVPRKKFN